MSNACTLVPIHPPKFHYAYNLLNSHIANCNDSLYFIFTNDIDKNLFVHNIEEDKIQKFSSIVLDPELNRYSNIITVKKLYGVDILSKIYQYVAIFDSETLFVKPFDNYSTYKQIDSSRIFKGNIRKNSNHLRNLATYMGYENNENLINQTENFTQYWWFNEICVYESEKFKEFYQWYRSHPNYTLMQNKFECFDYLLYSIWLICNKGYNVKKYMQNIICNGAMIETNYSDNATSYAFESVQDRNINHESISHIKVQIMLDRDIDHCYNKEGVRTYENFNTNGG
jgi:hypothetical protein